MREVRQERVKGMLPKLLVWLGIEPTEKHLFRARITIVVVCCLTMTYFYVTGDDAGDSYGNFNEFKAQLQ